MGVLRQSMKNENVSEDNQFRDLVGAKYKTLVELKIHGVTLGDLGKGGKTVDEYDVAEAPRSAGREVIENRDLDAGSTI